MRGSGSAGNDNKAPRLSTTQWFGVPGIDVQTAVAKLQERGIPPSQVTSDLMEFAIRRTASTSMREVQLLQVVSSALPMLSVLSPYARFRIFEVGMQLECYCVPQLILLSVTYFPDLVKLKYLIDTSGRNSLVKSLQMLTNSKHGEEGEVLQYHFLALARRYCANGYKMEARRRAKRGSRDEDEATVAVAHGPVSTGAEAGVFFVPPQFSKAFEGKRSFNTLVENNIQPEESPQVLERRYRLREKMGRRQIQDYFLEKQEQVEGSPGVAKAIEKLKARALKQLDGKLVSLDQIGARVARGAKKRQSTFPETNQDPCTLQLPNHGLALKNAAMVNDCVAAYPFRQVISDIDQTFLITSSGRNGPECPTGATVGFRTLYQTLAPLTTFLSIRPNVLNMDSVTRTLLQDEAKWYPGEYGLLLAGNASSIQNFVLGNDQKNGVRKFDVLKQHALLYPECDFFLFGDMGEGDLRLMLEVGAWERSLLISERVRRTLATEKRGVAPPPDAGMYEYPWRDVDLRGDAVPKPDLIYEPARNAALAVKREIAEGETADPAAGEARKMATNRTSIPVVTAGTDGDHEEMGKMNDGTRSSETITALLPPTAGSQSSDQDDATSSTTSSELDATEARTGPAVSSGEEEANLYLRQVLEDFRRREEGTRADEYLDSLRENYRSMRKSLLGTLFSSGPQPIAQPDAEEVDSDEDPLLPRNDGRNRPSGVPQHHNPHGGLTRNGSYRPDASATNANDATSLSRPSAARILNEQNENDILLRANGFAMNDHVENVGPEEPTEMNSTPSEEAVFRAKRINASVRSHLGRAEGEALPPGGARRSSLDLGLRPSAVGGGVRRSSMAVAPGSVQVLQGGGGKSLGSDLVDQRLARRRFHMFVRDIVDSSGLKRQTSQSDRQKLWQEFGVFVVNNGADAALHAFETLRAISLAELRDIGQTCVDEFSSQDWANFQGGFSDMGNQQIRQSRAADVRKPVERINDYISGKLTLVPATSASGGATAKPRLSMLNGNGGAAGPEGSRITANGPLGPLRQSVAPGGAGPLGPLRQSVAPARASSSSGESRTSYFDANGMGGAKGKGGRRSAGAMTSALRVIDLTALDALAIKKR
ncbi:unnamed protein product [Amoebophrya sp. A25]|nr:unnamed protein product [Amoebophrya sp. A25]|eukprot:GSA25T00009749001.1